MDEWYSELTRSAVSRPSPEVRQVGAGTGQGVTNGAGMSASRLRQHKSCADTPHVECAARLHLLARAHTRARTDARTQLD